MASDSRPLIVVTGATGRMGGSVVRFLLDDGSFRIRAVTRKVESDEAKALKAKGVEVVYADFRDPKSLREAFEGAYGVFGMTNFWEYMDQAEEIRQGQNIVDAAVACGVKHFVWTALERTELVHANAKADIYDYAKASGIPCTGVWTVFFFENFLSLWPLTKVSDDHFKADWPLLWSDGEFVAFAAADTGAFVLECFKNSQEWIGKDMMIMSERVTPRQLVKHIQDVSGIPIEFNEITLEKFEELSKIPETAELYRNMKHNYEQEVIRDAEMSRRIYPGLQTLKMWVENNLDAILQRK